MYLYIPVEVKDREFQSRLMLALLAAHRGWTVYIGRIDEISLLARSRGSPVGAYFDKSIQRGKYQKLASLKMRGFRIFSQDEEGGFLDSEYDGFARRRFDSSTLSLVDRVYCWGRFDFQSLTTMYPEYRNKFMLSGSPRADLWREDFAGGHKQKSQRYRGIYAPFVLFSSNFAFVHGFYSLDELLAIQESQGMIRSESDRQSVRDVFADQLRMRDAFVELVTHLASRFRGVTFIVRPHPVENSRFWEDLVGGYPNIKVIREGDVAPWIRSAAAVIHNGCTTGLEAAAMATPVAAYLPHDSRHARSVPNSVSEQIRDISGMASFVQDAVFDGNQGGARDSVCRNMSGVKERFANIEGLPAMVRILEDIESSYDIAAGGLGDSAVWRYFWGMMLRSRDLGQKSRAKVLGRSHPGCRKFGGINRSEILAGADAIESIFPEISGRLGLKNLGRSVVRVSFDVE
ncbi:surface carbohydrate biosynthesis protein [Thioalkalivibrio sp. ALE19]|uniref:surface carbohydrate biosynthesis protein n=1 Tax=Thioalkalivibrio sp. ALE19 TaxID=1266909 RepID=UPI0009DBEFD1|nr:surface carbohydrate biosynthesis protein [Thioalkalivibrio sp. ALE19]